MPRTIQGNQQNILVVEDDGLVLKLVKIILERGGFNVLPAQSAQEAMLAEAGFKGEIHLLISDVMMPGMQGPDLAEAMKKRRPELRVMLMSGYADGSLLILNYGWHFIKKPFVAMTLLGKVKEVLNGESRDQGTDHFDVRQ